MPLPVDLADSWRENLFCGVCYFVGETSFQIILGQGDERVFMIRHEFDDLLIVGDRIPPVLFLFLDLGHEEIGLGILWVNLENIS